MTFRLFLLVLVLQLVCVNCPATARGQTVIDSALLQLVEQVDVPARTAGVLSAVNVNEGTTVEVGMPLGQIDDRQSRMLYRRAEIEFELSKDKSQNDVAIRSAQQSLAYARSEFNRMERATSGLPGSISQSQLEEAKLKAGQAQLELESAEYEARQNKLTEQLKQQELALGKYEIDVRRLLAPVPGVVVEVLRHAGEWVEPGDKVVRIVRIDRLRADGLIHVDSVAPNLRGMPATVAIGGGTEGERQFPGKVVFVSPEVNPVNGLVRISVEFDNARNTLRPGLRARITIPSPAAAAPTHHAAGGEK